MPPADELQGLRALHLPPAAPAFWADIGLAVALGLLAALILSLAWRLLARPRLSLRAEALAAFEHASALPVPERRAAQAALLRRVVRSVEGEDAARTSGPAWSATLDRVFRTDLFAAREGRVFADGLYARPAKTDDPTLDDELGALLQTLER